MRIIVGMSLALVFAGCGSGQPDTPRPAPESVAVVRVDNQSWANFNIFVVADGFRHRLGRSTSNTRTFYDIPPELTGNRTRLIQFELDPIGAQTSRLTRRVQVVPGDTVDIRIPPN